MRERVDTARPAALRRMALVSTTALAGLMAVAPMVAAADGAAPGARAAATAVAGETATAYAIAPQSLDGALARFGEASGVQVVYDSAVTAGLTSPGAAGSLSAEQALGRILGGTGLSYRFTGPRSVTVLRPARSDAMTLDPVLVGGSAGRSDATGPTAGYVARSSVSATKTDTPLMETAQSISVVTAERIADQKAQRVEDALRYTAGVQVSAWGYDPRFDQITIRGFEGTTNADYRDGLRQPYTGWLSMYRTDPYTLERIDVVKGPNSVLFGQISPGGLVNRVTKRPTEETVREVEAQIGGHDRHQAQFDVGGKATADGDLLFRVVGVGRDSGTHIDGINDDTAVLAPSLTWRAGEDTTLTFLAQYQYDQTAGSPRPFQMPTGRLTHFWPGDEDFDKLEQTQALGGYEIAHILSDAVTLRQNLRVGTVETDNQYTDATLAADGHTLNRTAWGIYEDMTSLAVDTQGEVRFTTGALRHTVVGGIDYSRVDGSVDYRMGAAPPIDMLAPDHNQVIGRPGTALVRQDLGADMVGVYAQDQVEIDRWRLSFGLRHDWSKSTQDDLMTGTSQSQSDEKFTGRVGVLYLTDFGLAPFASYATSFLPEVGTNAYGQPYKPTEGRQIEAGVKYQPPGLDSVLTASVFELTQSNVKTTDPANPANNLQTGEQRSRGLELEGVADIGQGLKLTAAYTYLDAEITRSNAGDEGNRPIGIPEHMVSAWADYTVPEGPFGGLGGGVGGRWVGATFDDAANTVENDSFAVADLALHYDLPGDFAGARLGLNVSNLFDNDYEICQSGFCYRDAGRTVLGSLRYRW